MADAVTTELSPPLPRQAAKGEALWKETLTMQRYFPIALAVATVALAGHAMAAEVDMAKLTCKEVAAMSAPKTIAIAMWMNGYVHGKAGNTMLDGDMAEANAVKVVAYCKQNPDATLASALEAVAKT